MCAQRRLRSAWASTDGKDLIDWVDAQAELNVRFGAQVFLFVVLGLKTKGFDCSEYVKSGGYINDIRIQISRGRRKKPNVKINISLHFL